MADSGDSASSWPGLVGSLNKTFNLLRDAFGYALPGAVFLVIAIMAKKGGHGGFSLQEVKDAVPFAVSPWACLLVGIAACYAIGDVLAAIAYSLISLGKWIQWQPQSKFLYPLHKTHEEQKEFHDWLREGNHAVAYDRLKDHPTEVTGDLLNIQLQHPEFCNALDRRETMALMSGSMCVAVLGGWVLFYLLELRAGNVLLVAGLFLLVQFCTAFSHMRRVRRAVREAAALAHAPDPDPATVLGQAVLGLIKAATQSVKNP